MTVDLEVPANAQIVLEASRGNAAEGLSAITPASTASGRLPGLPPDVHHPPQAPGLPHDRRRDSADGGLLPRQGQRADLSALDSEDRPRDRRHALPAEGIFHNLVIISMDKRYPGHARKIMNACWGLGQLMFSKTIIVVDKDVDVQNLSEVAWIVGTTTIRSRTSSSRAALWTTSRTPATCPRTAARWVSTPLASGPAKDSHGRGRRRSRRPRRRRRCG